VTRNPRPEEIGRGLRRVAVAIGAVAVVVAIALASGAVAASSAEAGTAATVVDIKGSTAEWREKLVAAVGTPNTTVRLGPEVDMDMGDLGPIDVVSGVTIMSVSRLGTPGAVDTKAVAPPVTSARRGRFLGPVLYTKKSPRPLFKVECFPDGTINDHVRFTGFRLRGPHPGVESGDDEEEIGIQIVNCVDVEISNMEIAGWSGMGVSVVDDPRFDGNGRISRPDQIQIHGNFIHNNQHVGKDGYGVAIGVGATARIEQNVFDLNRHSIQAEGKSDGYVAAWNLVLKGGGYHRVGFHTHSFDVHGSKNCSKINDAAWDCGRAGGTVVYEANAFQYTKGNAIKIRGTPEYQATINRNVFANRIVNDTLTKTGGIALTLGRKHIKIGKGPLANRAGIDPFGKYGVCDFDGDGFDDLFLATGVTWWYASGGDTHWSYLNLADEQLDQVRLGYFDDDLRCDVLAENTGNGAWEISSGGTAPWRALGSFGVPLKEVVFGQFGSPQKYRVGETRPTTHAFRRAPDGQWYITPLTTPAWTPAQSSSTPLKKLRFGDFTGDGVTDVLAVQGGRWAISDGARGEWARLNDELGSDVSSLLVADVDADGRDDLIRFQPANASSLTPSFSSGGSSSWTRLKLLTELTTPTPATGATVRLSPFVGRFDDVLGVDVMAVGNTRMGRFANGVGGVWRSAYAY
jgi:hypothetical protein